MNSHRKPSRHDLIDFPVWESVEANGMDVWLDHMETLMTAISQRRMTRDQLERYTKLIHGAEAESVARKAAADRKVA